MEVAFSPRFLTDHMVSASINVPKGTTDQFINEGRARLAQVPRSSAIIFAFRACYTRKPRARFFTRNILGMFWWTAWYAELKEMLQANIRTDILFSITISTSHRLRTSPKLLKQPWVDPWKRFLLIIKICVAAGSRFYLTSKQDYR